MLESFDAVVQDMGGWPAVEGALLLDSDSPRHAVFWLQAVAYCAAIVFKKLGVTTGRIVADDLAQTAMVRLVKRLKEERRGFSSLASLKGWLQETTENLANDWLRRQRVYKKWLEWLDDTREKAEPTSPAGSTQEIETASEIASRNGSACEADALDLLARGVRLRAVGLILQRNPSALARQLRRRLA
jgi:DNA-directed RNA polymerase specialized sigma24 family protein